MQRPLHLLVIDDNADSRTLLVRTLLRKYPNALMHECQDANTAVTAVRSETIDAAIVHRAFDHDGITLVSMLRQANPTVPILMVSGIDRSAAAAVAGADGFLNYDEWLRVGTVVHELLNRNSAAEDAAAGAAQPA